MKFLALLFGSNIYKPYSALIRFILQLRGIRIGKNFYIQGVPMLKIHGKSSDIIIGENVSVLGNIDLRNRESGKIIIGNEVAMDTDCRFVSANNAVLRLENGCCLGNNCVFNAGTNITVGKNSLIAGYCHIQSSNHGISKNQLIKDQKHNYGEIDIGKDCWLGNRVIVTSGVKIEDGAVVGAGSVVTKNLESYTINAGVPTKFIRNRN